MVSITSSEYQCENGKTLNVGRWWTEPISIPKQSGTFGLCGGNIPVANSSGTGTDSCILVDTYSCKVTPTAPAMKTTRQALQPICLTNSQCYLFGGNTGAISDLTKSIDSFSLTTKGVQKSNLRLPEPRLCYAATQLNDTDFLITGGYGAKDPTTGRGPVYNTAIRVDTSSGKLITIPMMHQRGGHSITKLSDGTYLVLGGNGDDSNGGEIYDPKTNTFTSLASKMSVGRKDHRAILASNRKVYIIGGSGKEGCTTTIEVYNPATKTFSDSGLKVSEGREDLAVVYIERLDVIVAVGGEIKGKDGEPVLAGTQNRPLSGT